MILPNFASDLGEILKIDHFFTFLVQKWPKNLQFLLENWAIFPGIPGSSFPGTGTKSIPGIPGNPVPGKNPYSKSLTQHIEGHGISMRQFTF